VLRPAVCSYHVTETGIVVVEGPRTAVELATVAL
jgi:hypothetical protein